MRAPTRGAVRTRRRTRVAPAWKRRAGASHIRRSGPGQRAGGTPAGAKRPRGLIDLSRAEFRAAKIKKRRSRIPGGTGIAFDRRSVARRRGDTFRGATVLTGSLCDGRASSELGVFASFCGPQRCESLQARNREVAVSQTRRPMSTASRGSLVREAHLQYRTCGENRCLRRNGRHSRV